MTIFEALGLAVATGAVVERPVAIERLELGIRYDPETGGFQRVSPLPSVHNDMVTGFPRWADFCATDWICVPNETLAHWAQLREQLTLRRRLIEAQEQRERRR